MAKQKKEKRKLYECIACSTVYAVKDLVPLDCGEVGKLEIRQTYKNASVLPPEFPDGKAACPRCRTICVLRIVSVKGSTEGPAETTLINEPDEAAKEAMQRKIEEYLETMGTGPGEGAHIYEIVDGIKPSQPDALSAAELAYTIRSRISECKRKGTVRRASWMRPSPNGGGPIYCYVRSYSLAYKDHPLFKPRLDGIRQRNEELRLQHSECIKQRELRDEVYEQIHIDIAAYHRGLKHKLEHQYKVEWVDESGEGHEDLFEDEQTMSDFMDLIRDHCCMADAYVKEGSDWRHL